MPPHVKMSIKHDMGEVTYFRIRYMQVLVRSLNVFVTYGYGFDLNVKHKKVTFTF